MAEICLDHVTKIFPNGVTALCEVCLTIGEGELVVILGPSGCGKTTLLRLISGLETPTSGAIKIAGKLVNGIPPAQRNLGFVFQLPALYPQFDVRRNLLFGESLRQNPFRRAWQTIKTIRVGDRADLPAKLIETVRVLGLNDLLNRLPRELSGGQQQRVALGRAMMRDPVAYLLDEPLSSLDLHQRTELRQQLHLLQRHLHATMLYVTHDQTEAMALADRVLVISQGIVQQSGPPMEVYSKPVNRFVAGFIGSPPMMFLAGRLCRDEAGFSLTNGESSIRLSDETPRQLKACLPDIMTVGIRPEHVGLGRSGSEVQSESKLNMEVVAVESLGFGSLVTLRRGSWELTSQQYGSGPWVSRSSVEVFLNVNHLHWFDSDSGKSLNLGVAS
jgi:multiple sugar transport system ATP-binding protein